MSARARRWPIVIGRNSPRHVALLLLGVVAAAVLIDLGSGIDPFDRSQLARVMIYAIAIAGLNIVTGYGGMISVGHSAFFGLGAYTTGVLVVRYGWEAVYTIPVAFAVCFVVGLVVGLPALRIRGLYLAMVTLAFGIAFPEVVDRFDSLTGGAQGLTIRRLMLRPPDWSGFSLGEKDVWLYWLSAVLLIVVMVLVHNLVRSRYGLALVAARDSEVAAAASGVNLAAVKTVAFGISGAITGIGGSLFAIYLGTLVADDSFTLLSAISLLTGLVIGGQGTRFGPILGAVAVVYIPYYSSDLGQGQSAAVIFGAVLIAIIFIVPEGVVGGFFRFFHNVLVVVPAIRRRPVPSIEVADGPPPRDGAGDLPIGSSSAPPSSPAVPLQKGQRQ